MAKRKRSVIPLDRPVQVSRAQADIPDVGLREVRISRRPGELSLELEEFSAPSTPLQKAKVVRFPDKPSE